MCFPGSQWERGFPGCRQPLTPQESQCGPDLTNGRWTPEKDGHFLVVPEARLKKKNSTWKQLYWPGSLAPCLGA